MKSIVLLLMLPLSGCATAVAVADVTGSTVIYTGRTVINAVDAITPDIVNSKDKQ